MFRYDFIHAAHFPNTCDRNVVENSNVPIYNDRVLSETANDTFRVIEADDTLAQFPAIHDHEDDLEYQASEHSDVEQYYPAMNPDQLLNPDLSNTYQFEISGDSNHCHTSSTPRQVTTRATDNPKNTGILVLPNMITDKILIRKFSGYSHEDAENFLAEFESFMTLQSMDLQQDLRQSHARKLPLSMCTWPALRRFGSIHSHPQTNSAGIPY